MKPTRKWFLMSLLIALTFAHGALGQSGGRGGAFSAAPDTTELAPPNAEEGPACDIDAVIYKVSLPAEQIARIDLVELQKSASKAEDFEKAIAKIGKVQPLYRVKQSVMLKGDSMEIGSQTPFVTNSTNTTEGQIINTIQYSNFGAVFNLAGRVLSENTLGLKMRIQLSTMSESEVVISDRVNPPIFRTATLVHTGQVEANKPFLLMSVSASASNEKKDALAYIAKIKLGEPSSK